LRGYGMSITCVIVSYNNGEYMRQAVESVVVQTRPVDEIIVADDASSDGSQDLIRELAAEHDKIRPIFREQNLGVNRNRDLAIRAAAGDFVTFLDGDDFYYENKLALEWQALEAANTGVACSNIDVVDAGGAVIETRDFSAFVGMPREDKVKLLALRPGANPRDFLMPKKIYEQAGGFRSKFALYGDVDFKIRLAALPVKWVWSGCVGAAFRRTGSGLSSALVKEHAKALRLLLAENETLLTEILGARGYRRALKVVPAGRFRARARRWLGSAARVARRRLIGESGV